MKSTGNSSESHRRAGTTLRRLLRYALASPNLIIISFVTVILSTLFGLLPPRLLQYGIDTFIEAGEFSGLPIVAFGMLAAAILQGVADFAKRYASEHLAQSVIHDIRSDIYRHLTRLSFSFYDSSRTGDIMARVTADADSLRRFIANAFAFVIANIFIIVGVAVVIFSWDVRLGLLYVLFVPLMVHAMRTYAGKVRPAFGWVRKKLANLTEELQEDLVGIEVIKLFGQEGKKCGSLRKKVKTMFRPTSQRQRSQLNGCRTSISSLAA